MNEKVYKCNRCKDTKSVQVLGGGGDYENWPCPDCDSEEYRKTLVDQYRGSCYDGSAD